MGTQRYTTTRGQRANQVTVAAGSAIAADTVRVDIDFTAAMERADVLESLRQIKEVIETGPWPPAAP